MRKYFFILLLISCSVYAETEFKIFTLQHRFASDLLPIIEPMVGADGTATGMNNQLILRAQPARMREIEETITKLDASRVNRKITVSTSNNVKSQQARVEATGAIKVGKVTVGNDRQASPISGRVEIARNSSNL